MDRVSDELLEAMIDFATEDLHISPSATHHYRLLALVELRERRAAEKKAYKHFCHMCANPVQLCKCTDRT
jgi:hypothetical protein